MSVRATKMFWYCCTEHQNRRELSNSLCMCTFTLDHRCTDQCTDNKACLVTSDLRCPSGSLCLQTCLSELRPKQPSAHTAERCSKSLWNRLSRRKTTFLGGDLSFSAYSSSNKVEIRELFSSESVETSDADGRHKSCFQSCLKHFLDWKFYCAVCNRFDEVRSVLISVMRRSFFSSFIIGASSDEVSPKQFTWRHSEKLERLFFYVGGGTIIMCHIFINLKQQQQQRLGISLEFTRNILCAHHK